MSVFVYLCFMAKVEEIPVKSLNIYEFNPRDISTENSEKLKLSLLQDKNFMYSRPLLVNKTSKGLFVYAGAQRLRICRELGWSKIPGFIDEDLPEELIKSRMLKDNLHYGEWDVKKLEAFGTELIDSMNLTELMPVVDLGTLEVPEAPQPKPPKSKFTFKFSFQTKQAKKDFIDLLLKLKENTGLGLEEILKKG